MKELEKFDFVGKIKIFSIISLSLFLGMIIYLFLKGLPFGIDFSGGSEIQIQFSKDVTISDLRKKLSHFEQLTIQEFGTARDYVLRLQLPQALSSSEVNALQNQIVEKIKKVLIADIIGPEDIQVVRVDSVGPQVGQELKRSGFLAIFYSLLVVLIYISMRFDYKFSPGAVLCLIHDVVITLGIYVGSGREINIPVIAAILTLIGYSLNDTIVVYDRIREIEEKFPKMPFKQVINRALNDMWQRTVITSGTTLSVGIALLVLTQGTISDIAFILSIGIIIGTYSSIYIAAPLTLGIHTIIGDKPINIIPKPKFSE